MFWSLKKKQPLLTPELYNQIGTDIAIWCANELTNIPPQMVEGVQNNALLNFAAYDIHVLATQEGFDHMLMILEGRGTEQTVMIRLKQLVAELYIKYGEDIIDELRHRVYKTLTDLYALNFDIENDLDVNNTFWLYPFIVRMMNEVKSKQ